MYVCVCMCVFSIKHLYVCTEIYNVLNEYDDEWQECM